MEEGTRGYIQFARLTHSGRADYIWQNPRVMNDRLNTYADGNNYCNMDGDGLNDYIWVLRNFYLYHNLNNPPQWYDHGMVFDKKWDRQFIRIADIDGDRKCDLIFLNEGGSGEVVNWFKTDFKDGQWSFQNQYELEQVGACRGEKQRNGVGLFNLAVRFADLNGDKRADHLCIDPNGRTFAMVWYNVNDDPAAGSLMTWRPGGNAYRQSARGDCIHFGDLRGSGHMDMIDATPRTNKATTWFSKPCAGGGSGDNGLIHDPNLPKINKEQGNVPFPQFPRFIVLGDSYLAGIGAGAAVANDRWDESGWCHRNQGAYSHLLWQRDDILRDRAMEFISCTGAKANNLLTNKQHSYRPGPQLDMLKTLPADSYGWGTLSLGGNDIGFTPIIFTCLLGGLEDACEDAIANAQRLTDGTELEEQLIEVYTRILETAQTPDFTLIVTGYAQFFNKVTDLCDSKSLALLDPLPILWSPLVKAIRARLNALVRGINAVIDRTVEAVNKRYADKHIHYFSIDGLFDTHCLCDADPTTGHDNEEWRNDAWFYTLVRNTDPLPAGRITSLQAAQESDDVADLGYVDLSDCPAEGTEEDTDFGIACMVLRQIYANQEEPGTGTPPRGPPLADVLGFFFKSFHPKQQAHDAIAKGIKDWWGKSWGKWGPVSPS
ncbi:SGNH hydrolase-type esterase domain-containing protein [Aspergillus insuetus]